MYTVVNDGAVGIVDGYAQVDCKQGEDIAADLKLDRERNFPIELAKHALSIRLQSATASREEDRRCILNSIVGSSDLNAMPPAEHTCYDQLNGILRGRIAAATWLNVLERGECMAQHQISLAGSGLTSLTFVLAGSLAFKDQDAEQLAACLPTTLQVLKLDFRHCRALGNVAIQAFSAALPPGLKELSLNFNHCRRLTDTGLDGLSKAFPCGLSVLSLDFNGCSRLTDVAVCCLFAGLAKLRLTKLFLDFSYCTVAGEIVQAFILHAPKTLQNVDLWFVGCPGVYKEIGHRALEESLGASGCNIEFYADYQ